MSTTSIGPPQGIEESGSRIEERRERQRRDARESILDAAEDLIIEAGGSNFSIRSLGQRSGYSAPTVYHYFHDKDGLIDALLEHRVDRLATEFEQLRPSGDPRRDLRAMLLAYFEFSASNPAFTRLMGTFSRKGESHMPPAMDRVRKCVDEQLDRCTADAAGAPGDHRDLAGQVYAVHHQINFFGPAGGHVSVAPKRTKEVDHTFVVMKPILAQFATLRYSAHRPAAKSPVCSGKAADRNRAVICKA